MASPDHPSDAGDPISLIVDPAVAARVDTARLGRALRAASEHLDRPVHRVAIRIVGDAEMTRLHRLHLSIDEPTDVLTFDASEDAAPGASPNGSPHASATSAVSAMSAATGGSAAPHGVDADIACCLDVAERAAAERDHDTTDELLLYALHGLLHCAGFDDRDPADAAAMHGEEDRILTAIGARARYAGRPMPAAASDAAAAAATGRADR